MARANLNKSKKDWTFSTTPSKYIPQCTEVRFASFFSGGITIMAVMNPPEKKLEKHTCVQWAADKMNFEEMIDPLQ